MFLKTVVILLILILSSAAAAPLSDPAHEEFVLINSNDFNMILRHMVKREVTFESVDEANEPVDKDYDMELAEVNVFRPVFRFRASYARRGG